MSLISFYVKCILGHAMKINYIIYLDETIFNCLWYDTVVVEWCPVVMLNLLNDFKSSRKKN